MSDQKGAPAATAFPPIATELPSPPGIVLVAHLFIIFYEEPALRRLFGESYEEYRRAVPRWIPKFRV